MYLNNPLKLMQKMLSVNYELYKTGVITQSEYIERIKPIDKAIDKLEMATLQDTPVLKVSSSEHIPKLRN